MPHATVEENKVIRDWEFAALFHISCYWRGEYILI